MACTGWTWQQARNLTFPQYKALCAQWRKTPPAHVLLAGYVGYKAPPEVTPESQGEQLNELAGMAGVAFQG